ncbi:alpha/beta hydrolase [Streptomyces sp. NPDC008159]|uniref:alpha/beta hydrolase n=1 Tax=Streptomyces sp. NPDC008159 TaxID=3364817 RepID=UPI0036E1503B
MRHTMVAGGVGHGVYGSETCADKTVTAYLTTGKLPAKDVTCKALTTTPEHGGGSPVSGWRALTVTLYSVVFRFSRRDLTTAGTYIEMTSRLTNPTYSAWPSSPSATAANADRPATAACGSPGVTVRFHRLLMAIQSVA